MSRKIVVHDDARFDIIDIAFEIAENNLRASDRFIKTVDLAFKQLVAMPNIGVVREYNNPKLVGMRMWPVPGFNKHLIFYLADENELRVLRILHGARDLESYFKPVDEGDTIGSQIE